MSEYKYYQNFVIMFMLIFILVTTYYVPVLHTVTLMLIVIHPHW